MIILLYKPKKIYIGVSFGFMVFCAFLIEMPFEIFEITVFSFPDPKESLRSFYILGFICAFLSIIIFFIIHKFYDKFLIKEQNLYVEYTK